jgi:anaphase-promoting complex subunit 8
MLTCDQDHLQAQEIFSEVLRTNPQRIDSLDKYSNILHVSKQTPKLSFLAQLTTSVDKFRPETCCVVGNYYSRTSQHEKP